MQLSIVNRIIFIITCFLNILFTSINIHIINEKADNKKNTINFKVLNIISLIIILITLIMMISTEIFILSYVELSIYIDIIGFILLIINLIINIGLLILLFLIKYKHDIILLYFISPLLLLTLIIIFISYPYAVTEKDWF